MDCFRRFVAGSWVDRAGTKKSGKHYKTEMFRPRSPVSALNRYLPFLLIGAVAIIAIGAGLVLFQTKKQRLTAVRRAASEAAAILSLTSKRGADPPHVRGPDSAPVTLEEFGDFQCPPCGDLSPVLEKLEQDYRTQLRVIFRQLPLSVHRYARDAACASEAAGLQGCFWEMHDSLYHNRFDWPRRASPGEAFEQYAKSLGLYVERFIKDLHGEEVTGRIAADQLRAKALGVDRTPVVFINNVQVPLTSLNPPGLHAAVNAALEEKAEFAKDHK
jgi:protein-disulfide isomerase